MIFHYKNFIFCDEAIIIIFHKYSYIRNTLGKYLYTINSIDIITKNIENKFRSSTYEIIKSLMRYGIMKEKGIYFTVNGVNHFHGIKVFKINSLMKLVKEPENNYDDEAIRVELRYAGPSGYVANSVKTVAKGSYSAGRLYDKILDVDYAKVKFIIGDAIIAKVLTSEEVDQEKSNPDSDINYI